MADEFPVTPRTGVALPSERYRISGVPEGFTSEPDQEHLDRASDVIAELCAEVRSTAIRQGKPLAIRLCHSRFAAGLPLNLFGFHVWSVDASGQLSDPLAGQDELSYALIVNQPVELQLETAITFMRELGARQSMLQEIGGNDDRFARLPDEAIASDRDAATDVVERFRYGWREAARAATEALASAGFSVEIRYERDVFPRREDIDRRLPWLRRVYNEIDPVRETIDRIVSTIGGREMSIRGGGAEVARGWTQQQLTLLDVRRYTNHAIRDAEVCGNGYLVFNEIEPFAPYAGRPENVRIRGDNAFELREDNGWLTPTKQVMHIRGIDQIDSPYGMSMLEPFVYAIDRADRLERVKERQEELIRSYGLTYAQRSKIEDDTQLIERILATTMGDVRAMLRFFHEHIEEPGRSLYLPGHELYG